MPLIQERTFRVRHYECDARGRVGQANYVRYMQEAAFDASAAAGYDMARYADMGRHWLVRETDIEVLRPLYYGDVVRVKTWVADFRLVRSRRAYELWLADSARLAARAHTDWVFMDSATWQPTTIPEEMMAAFFPEGPPQQAPPRPRFPAAPPPPPGAFRLRRRAEWRDIDAAQHVNNAVYLAYLEDCGLQAASAHGWSPQRMRAAGFDVVAQQHRIEYLLPAMLDDELELTTWVSDAQPDTAIRHYTVVRVRDGALLARGRTLWGCVDAATGQPVHLPQAFLADLSPGIAPPAR